MRIQISHLETYDNYSPPTHPTEGNLIVKDKIYPSYQVLFELLIKALNPRNVREPRYVLQIGGELPQRSILDTKRGRMQVCFSQWINIK